MNSLRALTLILALPRSGSPDRDLGPSRGGECFEESAAVRKMKSRILQMSRLVTLLNEKIRLARAVRDSLVPPGDGSVPVEAVREAVERRARLVAESASLDLEFEPLWEAWRSDGSPRKDPGPGRLAKDLISLIREIQERDRVWRSKLESLRDSLGAKLDDVRKGRAALGAYSSKFRSTNPRGSGTSG